MSHKHANKEGGKGVHTQQSNQGGKDTSQDQVKGQKKSNSQQHDDTQSDSLDYQQGEKSENIKPNRQKGEDNQKTAGGNPQPTQPTATDTLSIGSSPKPTAAKSQQTAADTQTTVVSPQPTAAKSQQTAADTQTTGVSPQLTAAKFQRTTGDTQPIRTSPLPIAAKSQHTVADTQPIGTNPQPTAAYTQTTGVNPKPKGGNLQQIGDNPQHKDLSETKSKDIGEEGQITMKPNKSSPKENTTHRREASYHYGQENRDSRSEFSDDEQYDMTEANRIEKSRSRTDMDDWTNQSWIPKINIVTVIFCVVFTIMYTQCGQVPPVSPVDNSNVQKQLQEMEGDIRDKIKTMEKIISHLQNENEKYKTMLDDDITSKLGASEESVTDKIIEVEKSLKAMIESNTKNMEQIRKNIDDNSNKLRENEKRIEQTETDISNVKNETKEIKEISNFRLEMGSKIEKIEGEMSNTSETLKQAENAKKMLQDEVDKIEDMVDFLKANAFNKSAMVNLVVFLTIAVFALIIGMLIIWNRVSFDHHGNTPRHGSGTNPRMSVIEQVTKNPPLTNTICFISYGQMNESFNHKLVHKLMGQLSQPLQDTPVRGHLINSHADIANIPHCKLIFMCVEFSTRHVIIEEPGIGQGDIRRTTYNAVRKLGATLVILYTRDHDSRQLRDGLRYQSNIYCVTSQSELKVLDDKNCFYSVFDSFTPFQVEQLKDVIRNALQ